MSSLRARLREKPVEVVSTLVTGIWLTALILGFEWWLAALLIGYIVVVPLTSTLFGEEDETETEGHGQADATHTGERERSTEDELARLRERYARGDLSDAEFERELERVVGDGERAASGERERELE